MVRTVDKPSVYDKGKAQELHLSHFGNVQAVLFLCKPCVDPRVVNLFFFRLSVSLSLPFLGNNQVKTFDFLKAVSVWTHKTCYVTTFKKKKLLLRRILASAHVQCLSVVFSFTACFYL